MDKMKMFSTNLKAFGNDFIYFKSLISLYIYINYI